MDVAVAYWDDPAQVIWVDVGHRRMQGADNYWVAGNRYGMWQDPENRDTMYADAEIHEVAWEYDELGHHEVQLEDPTPPPDAQVWRGFMLSDEQARFVGIL